MVWRGLKKKKYSKLKRNYWNHYEIEDKDKRNNRRLYA